MGNYEQVREYTDRLIRAVKLSMLIYYPPLLFSLTMSYELTFVTSISSKRQGPTRLHIRSIYTISVGSCSRLILPATFLLLFCPPEVNPLGPLPSLGHRNPQPHRNEHNRPLPANPRV